MQIDATHDADLRSWIESANGCPRAGGDGDFPIQNLPYGIFRRGGEPHVGVAIGDRILDLHSLSRAGGWREFPEPMLAACRATTLNALMAAPAEAQSGLRRRLSEALRAGSAEKVVLEPHLCIRAAAAMELPANIGDFTDFYASRWHAAAVGALFRPSDPLLPNYRHLPIGYHGRSSSVVVGGTAVRRPWGQLPGGSAGAPADPPPTFSPTRQLDYELELGAFVGAGSALGHSVPLASAPEHLFGFCLLNDWSARDIQRWEYQPLGPFLGKSFATSISPWVVPLAALAPFRVAAAMREPGDPGLLAYLSGADDRSHGAFDITLEVWLASAAMREHDLDPMLVGRANARDLYWTFGQMAAHHTSNGCNLRPGDLLGSGTISGPGTEQRGCLLEATRGGADKITLPSGEIRRFLEDGDEVTLRGYCQRDGFHRIGFGECTAVILPAQG